MEENAQKAIVYKKQATKLTSKDAQELLQNPQRHLISSIPPFRPSANEIYIISSEDGDNRLNDWLKDGYQWVNRGGDMYPKKDPLMKKKYYNIRIMAGDRAGSSEFQRTSFTLLSDQTLVLVHYTGNEEAYTPRPHELDEEAYPRPHGNQKSDTVSYFTSTLP
jgi:hypothetical protein